MSRSRTVAPNLIRLVRDFAPVRRVLDREEADAAQRELYLILAVVNAARRDLPAWHRIEVIDRALARLDRLSAPSRGAGRRS